MIGDGKLPMDRTMLLFIRFIHNVHTHTSFLTRFLGLAWAFILVAFGYGLVLRQFSWLAKIECLCYRSGYFIEKWRSQQSWRKEPSADSRTGTRHVPVSDSNFM